MSVLTELRRAVRSLSQRPWFSVAAIASLAFGIGANATVFTIVNALLFRPLPYAEPDRLVFVRAENARLGVTRGAVTVAELEEIRARIPSLRNAGLMRESDCNITLAEQSRRVRGVVVSAAVLRALGVQPSHGGVFTDDDDNPGSPNRALVSDALWRSALGSTSILARATIRIDGAIFQVVGVMPPGFRFPERADLWISVGSAAGTRGPEPAARIYQLIARLAPNASIATLRAELASLARAMDEQRQASDRGWTLTALSAESERGESARPAVYLLLALVTCVLLIACSNLASLLTVRAAGRRRELSIRSALGASHARLVWHGLAESVVLASAGGVLSLLVTVAGVQAVRLAFPSDTLPFWLRFTVDWRVLMYALGLCVVTALAFGLMPALWSARRAPAMGLMSASRSATDTGRRGQVGSVVVAGQVAVSLILVVAASLLGAALRSMRTADLGYDPSGLLTTDVEPRARRYVEADSRRAFYVLLRQNLRAVPGVSGVTGFDVWGNAPVERGRANGGQTERAEAPVYAVLPSYFATLRVRTLDGRGIGDSDAVGAPPVAVVNETFARRYWPNESAVGQRVRIASRRDDPWLTVVGVVADVRRNPADLEHEPHVYIAALQFPPRRLQLIVRTELTSLTSSVLEDAARSTDLDEALGQILTMNDQIAVWTAPTRFFAVSIVGFAIVAMVIAATGVYGIVSGGVTARTREFGIRIALGATPARIVGLAVKRGARLSLIGAGIGLAGALGVSQLLVSLPFGVERVNAWLVAVAAVALVAVALVAAYGPALRAARVEPTIALADDS